jgi:hypothetical protein
MRKRASKPETPLRRAASIARLVIPEDLVGAAIEWVREVGVEPAARAMVYAAREGERGYRLSLRWNHPAGELTLWWVWPDGGGVLGVSHPPSGTLLRHKFSTHEDLSIPELAKLFLKVATPA